MSKPIDSHPDRRKGLGIRLAAMSGGVLVALAGVLQLPSGASAGVAAGAVEQLAPDGAEPAAAPQAKAPGTYQLRCWQYGRLLFDEGPVTLGAEARKGAKLVAADRRGGSVIVTDAGETVCQARPFPAAPNPALPR